MFIRLIASKIDIKQSIFKDAYLNVTLHKLIIQLFSFKKNIFYRDYLYKNLKEAAQ